MINNGRLKNRISILGTKKVVNSLKVTSIKWYEIKKVWAEIRPLRGNEYLEGVALSDKTTYKITIRHTDISQDNYIKWKNKYFNIVSVIDVENRHRTIELMCDEYVGKDIRIDDNI